MVSNDGRQPMLFSDASLHTLGFIKAGDLDADKLVSLIKEAKPRVIFDLRSVPSFARGTLTRRSVFALFQEHGVSYFDVAGVLGVAGGRDGLLNPALLVDSLQVNILRTTKGLLGPIFFFVNEDLFFEEYFSAVAKQLPHQDGRGWDIACWPNEAPPPDKKDSRDLVFISHANPQDNEIALWLAARLAASGYQVWSDVTRLIGGEVFWDTIEDAIRNRAAKVIVILSRAGHQKPGLLDEVNVAVATERSEKLERFVIPLRVDDLPFTEVRANLARKNIIDGHSDLAGALSKLLKILGEDGVSLRRNATQDALKSIQQLRPVEIDRREWITLFENKIEIVRWPSVIRKFRGGATKQHFDFAVHSVHGGMATFEDWDLIADANGGQVQRAGEAAFDPTGSSSATNIIFADRADARRATAGLMKQAWDKACKAKGFSPFVLANNNVCWFLPLGFQPGNRSRFIDQQGVERQKALVGQSPRRKVYWHFAIEARPSVADGSYRLIPHVVFSDNGKTPLSSHDRQHSLRRGFCRNWWNARWRDLLIAALNYMSGGTDTLHLPAASRQSIAVSARLKNHTSDPDNPQALSGAIRNSLMRLEEPKVAVGFNQESDYPKEGLLLFGPVAFERNPTVIRAGLIGTKEGIELFRVWSRQFNGFQADPTGSRNAMPFPGFEAVFGAKWTVDPVHTIPLSRTDLINAIRIQDRHQAIFKTSGMYVERISKAVRDDDINVDVWFVVIPDEVFMYGRPASRVPSAIAIASPGAMGRHLANRFLHSSPSLFPEDNEEAKIYDHHLDFHHQLKARLLDAQAVTQVLRESSLAKITEAVPAEGADVADASEPYVEDEIEEREESTDLGLIDEETIEDARALDSSIGAFEEIDGSSAGLPAGSTVRQMQDRASVAWNLATATFFKAGGRPWRVASARAGVCYIGLIFKRDPSSRSRQSCCGAQMFLQDSDGLVFKGAMGPWYSPETGQFHVSRSEARKLIEAVLKSYADEHRDPPRELFIHGRTRFNSEEWAGFCDAINLSSTQLVGVRITRSNDYKLYSSGERAVRRGTALQISPRVGLLWTTGFIEKLGTYPGRETPNPLRVEIVNDTRNDTKIDTVLNDIMMLTKMNFNSCVYADGIPVTMRFADAIGDVLITAKDEKVPPLPFRYYI
jgi:hypothetical protein